MYVSNNDDDKRTELKGETDNSIISAGKFNIFYEAIVRARPKQQEQQQQQ